jgi:hypothetical protein
MLAERFLTTNHTSGANNDSGIIVAEETCPSAPLLDWAEF